VCGSLLFLGFRIWKVWCNDVLQYFLFRSTVSITPLWSRWPPAILFLNLLPPPRDAAPFLMGEWLNLIRHLLIGFYDPTNSRSCTFFFFWAPFTSIFKNKILDFFKKTVSSSAVVFPLTLLVWGCVTPLPRRPVRKPEGPREPREGEGRDLPQGLRRGHHAPRVRRSAPSPTRMISYSILIHIVFL